MKTSSQVLQNKIDLEEQKVNCEIGAWVRQQTNVDSLKDFQNNFIISSQKNKSHTDKILQNETKNEVIGSIF